MNGDDALFLDLTHVLPLNYCTQLTYLIKHFQLTIIH